MVTFVNLWKDRQGMLFVEMHVSFISSFYFCLFIFAFLFLRLVPFFLGVGLYNGGEVIVYFLLIVCFYCFQLCDNFLFFLIYLSIASWRWCNE